MRPGQECLRAGLSARGDFGDAADLTRYRDGGGRDLTDLVLSARILGVSGQCQLGDKPSQLATKMQVTFQVTRGPAMTERQADLSIFVAVSEGSDILDKKQFPVRVAFPPNIDTVRLTTDAIPMVMPISKDKSGAAYALISGFQLTPDELALNCSRASR